MTTQSETSCSTFRMLHEKKKKNLLFEQTLRSGFTVSRARVVFGLQTLYFLLLFLVCNVTDDVFPYSVSSGPHCTKARIQHQKTGKDKIWGRPWPTPWGRPWGRPWCGGGQFSKKEKKTEISIIFRNIYATDYFRLLCPCCE